MQRSHLINIENIYFSVDYFEKKLQNNLILIVGLFILIALPFIFPVGIYLLTRYWSSKTHRYFCWFISDDIDKYLKINFDMEIDHFAYKRINDSSSLYLIPALDECWDGAHAIFNQKDDELYWNRTSMESKSLLEILEIYKNNISLKTYLDLGVFGKEHSNSFAKDLNKVKHKLNIGMI